MTAATTTASATRPPRRWRRRAIRLALGLLVGAAGWLALAIHPQVLFAQSLRKDNVVLHARTPFPAEAAPLLDDVLRRLARSPLHDPARTHHVFLCDTPALFALFALWDRNVGGIAQMYLTGNVFIRPSSITSNRVFGPSGQAKPGERTLAYFIAHEVAHAMTADRVGRWGYHRLAAFQQEGYADYVAFARPVDLRASRGALVRGDREMSPKLSGLYKRHELLVAYLLDRRGLTVDELLAARRDGHAVEQELLRDAL